MASTNLNIASSSLSADRLATITPNHLRLSALASFAMACCYILLFVLYGAVITVPGGADNSAKISYIVANSGLIKLSYIVGYILFALSLSTCALSMQGLFTGSNKVAVNSITVFGLMWSLILLATGMLAITGVDMMARFSEVATADGSATYGNSKAQSIFLMISLLESGLGGGIELLGGIWVLLIGLLGWQSQRLSTSLSVFSLVKGIIGISTLFFTEPVLRDLFGITGIVWFIWFGMALLGQAKTAQN